MAFDRPDGELQLVGDVLVAQAPRSQAGDFGLPAGELLGQGRTGDAPAQFGPSAGGDLRACSAWVSVVRDLDPWPSDGQVGQFCGVTEHTDREMGVPQQRSETEPDPSRMPIRQATDRSLSTSAASASAACAAGASAPIRPASARYRSAVVSAPAAAVSRAVRTAVRRPPGPASPARIRRAPSH